MMSGNFTVTGTGTKWALNGASGTTSAGALTINTGATVDLNANTFTTGGLSGAGTLTDSSTSKVFSITGSSSNSFSGAITGTTALTVNMTGAGTETLSGNNSYSGATTITAGTLVLGNNLALQNSTLSTAGAGVINVTGFTTPTVGGLTGSTNLASVITTGYSAITNLTLNTVSGVTDSYSGAIADGATGMSLAKTGLGSQTLSSINESTAYTGSTTVSGGGTLTLDFNDNGGSNAGTTPAYTLNGSTLNVHQNAVVATNLTNPLGTGTLTVAGSSYSESEAGSSGNAQQIFGNLTLNPGASNFFISAARGSSSSFSTGFNTVTRNAGGLVDFEIGSYGTYGAFGAAVQQYGVNSGSTVLGYLTYGGNDWLAPATSLTNGFQAYTGYTASTAGTTAPGTTADVDVQASNTTAWNTQTVNTLHFNTNTAATLTVASSNTLTVTHGGILLGSTVGTNNSTITGGNITSGNGNDLILINNNTTTSGGSLIVNSNIVNPSGGTIGITAGQSATTGLGVAVTVSPIQLGGTNTFSGPSYIDGGTVILESAGAWNGQSALNFAPYDATTTGGTFALNGNGITVNGLATTQSQLNPIVENAIGSSVGNAILTVNVASGANTYSGTLQNGTGGGTLALTKTGGGSLALSGQGTWTGGTNLSAGSLFANNATSSLGTGAVNVNGGLLAGNGVINNGSNQLTVAAGGKIGAGASATTPGTLTTGNETWNAGATYTWKLASPGGNGKTIGSGGSGAPGTTWDDLSMGTLNLSSAGGANAPIALQLYTPTAINNGAGGEYSWIIAQTNTSTAPTLPAGWAIGAANNLLMETVPADGTNTLFVLDTSSLGFSMNGVTNPTSGFKLELVNIGTGGDYDLVLDYNAAPEPGSAMLILAGALPMLMSRRRRRNKSNTTAAVGDDSLLVLTGGFRTC